MKLFKLYFVLFFLFTLNSFAQIEIDWNEMPRDVGTQWVKNSIINGVIVDLGSVGGPQTWDFTSQPMGSENSTVIIVDAASNPYIGSFPGANLVYASFEDSDTIYQYYKLNSNYLTTMGIAGVTDALSFFWEYDPSDSLSFPIRYGDSSRFKYGFIEEITPGNHIEYSHYGLRKNDAYGTVEIPYGSYECLRVRVYDTCAMTIYMGTDPIFFDTTATINYQFIAKNYAAVVCIESYPDESDTNYTEAFVLERLASFTSGIEDKENSANIECAHYPQLFSVYTTIQYSLPEQNHVELTFYDMSGRRVNTLVNDTQMKGSYSYRWYGNDDKGRSLGNGIYFYRLKADKDMYLGRVILIR